MKKLAVYCVVGFVGIFILSGCVVRTYQVTRDRVDQNLNEGNRGYIEGTPPPAAETAEKPTTRTKRVIEIELHNPIHVVKPPSEETKEAATTAAAPTMAEPQRLPEPQRELALPKREVTGTSRPQVNVEKYTVKKGDTLQKISEKYFGTTKKWYRIYEFNKEVLKTPSKIYPGQVINIPLEPLKEPKRNLK